MEKYLAVVAPWCYRNRKNDGPSVVDGNMGNAGTVEDLDEIVTVMALLMGNSLHRGSALDVGVACHREESNLAA